MAIHPERGETTTLMLVAQERYWILDFWTLQSQVTSKDIWYQKTFLKLGFEVCQLHRWTLLALETGRGWTSCSTNSLYLGFRIHSETPFWLHNNVLRLCFFPFSPLVEQNIPQGILPGFPEIKEQLFDSQNETERWMSGGARGGVNHKRVYLGEISVLTHAEDMWITTERSAELTLHHSPQLLHFFASSNGGRGHIQ